MLSACRRACAVLLASVAGLSAPEGAALAQGVPEIVVTPNYTATPIGRVGSTVSVVTRRQIARSSATTVAALLRTVPGVSIIESGGPGATTEVRLRGAETGHTVVLIDGVRVNDPATARDEFDFSLIALGDVERIEVLRGPQSAVYGSDAMGGVVNIITRKPRSEATVSASGEAGSYGTHVERLSGGAASGDFRFLMSGEHVATSGFSRVGDRDGDEPDGVEKWSGSFTASWQPAGGPTIEVGVRGTRSLADYDGAPPSPTTSCYQQKLDFAANAPNEVEKQLVSGHGKVGWSSHDGALHHSVSAFAMHGTRDNRETSASISGAGCPINSTSERETRFRSTNAGLEYRGVADLDALGDLLVGGKVEHEIATYRDSSTGFNAFDSDRTFYALFVEDQITFAERLSLSFTGRYDGEIDGQGFLTGRAAAAYAIPATGTRLRASVGTGTKRPTAYQIGNNFFAAGAFPAEDVDTDLDPERSFGVDAGIDQSLFDGAFSVSVTAFYNRFRDLLVFNQFSPSSLDGAFENVDRAETAGVEIAAEADILPGLLRGGISYTYLYSRNLDTGRPLPRRPEHGASFDLTFIGSDRFEMTLSGVLVGERLNRASDTTPMPGYGRLDLAARYFLAPGTELFARIENLTDVRYQDPLGFNAAGLSAYVGLSWMR